MQEFADFVTSLGAPLAFAVAFGYAIYRIGTVCGTLLIEAWRTKDTRLAALELHVQQINNGQREALERRFDLALDLQRESTEANQRVAVVLHEQAEALRGFVRQCPVLTDSDADRIADPQIDPKAAAVIARREGRAGSRPSSHDGGDRRVTDP